MRGLHGRGYSDPLITVDALMDLFRGSCNASFCFPEKLS